jgi:hypothetical protein
MDDIFGFFCGTVPILILLHWHGPRPNWQGWLTLIAGGIGGVIALHMFGPKYAADGALGTFLVAVAGGALLGQVVDLGAGIIGPDRQVRG